MRVRVATPADAFALATIYNQGIEDRVATFETRLRTPEEVTSWFDGVHPIVVVEQDGEELSHPEANFYIVGMKSYGRAPTFLMLTGYEQVRSIVAALNGDWEAARNIELVLPETGVCSTDAVSSCGLPEAAARSAAATHHTTPALVEVGRGPAPKVGGCCG